MSAQKRRVETILRRYRALAILTAALDPDSRANLEDDLRRVPDMHRSELLDREARALEISARLRADFGAKLPAEDYLQIVERAEAAPFEMLWVPKHYIEEHWFANPGLLSRSWTLYPPHTRFGIDTKWLVRTDIHSREWRLLEATLFEDVAMLWNDSYASRVEDTGKTGDDRIPGKRHRELTRSTVRAAFALVEGYLNGIAHDVFITRDITSLSKNAQELLKERDEAGLSRFKPLKAKLLGYPRLALNLEHAPIDEANCPEMAFILEKERQLRDAVMHPTPRAEPDRPILREQSFYQIELALADELITHVTGLIRRIDTELNGTFGRVELWLRDRGVDRLFPNRTFH